MNALARQILALFVSARRKHKHNWTPMRLAKELGVDAGQIRAVEKGQRINHEAALRLGQWCRLAWHDDKWTNANLEQEAKPEPTGEAVPMHRARAGPAQAGIAVSEERQPA